MAADLVISCASVTEKETLETFLRHLQSDFGATTPAAALLALELVYSCTRLMSIVWVINFIDSKLRAPEKPTKPRGISAADPNAAVALSSLSTICLNIY